MQEKDIENLIAQHPSEFFEDKKLRLIGQQVELSGYSVDIILEDENKTKFIVEVKKGILSREKLCKASIQIKDYYEIYKQKNPNEKIKLIIVANVIPKERLGFFKSLGIEDCEISFTKLLKVANKYSYTFLDKNESNIINEQKILTENINQNILSNNSNIWIFQANPERYDILEALSNKELEQDVWLVNQHKNEIKSGDIGLIWMSGKDSGIYAVIDIISNPEYMRESEDSAKYWVSESDMNNNELRIKYKYKIKLINNPVMREEIKNILELENMAILKQPQGTNFRVTDDEWKIISNLIKEHIK